MTDNSKTNQLEVFDKNPLLERVFIKDNDLSFIFRKIERIVAAIYLVTNFFSVKEPMKWDMRQSASNLLKDLMSFTKSSFSERENGFVILQNRLLELSTLVDVAYYSGFITEGNYRILSEELNVLSQKVLDYLNNQISSHKSLFDQETFRVNEFKTEFSEKENASRVSDIKYPSEGASFKGHNIKDKHSYMSFRNKTSENKPNIKTKTKSLGQSKRRETIIEEIKNKGEVSVKDIALVISDCSEKTLQRELLALVEEGVLNKTGERRWSRYSLKK